jgi:hypothetical protein
MENRYNGWTNYETWNLKLWLDNDQGLAEYWQEAARTAVDDTDETDDSDTRKREAAVELAEQLESDTRENAPDVTGFYGDMLNTAIGAVDYREIAEALIEDLDDD